MQYPIIYEDIIQSSPEWDAIRRGKITASVFKTAIGKGEGRRKLMEALRDDRTGVIRPPGIITGPMIRGTELESEAREQYITHNGPGAREVGFVELNEYIGASPDGLVGDDGMIEIKCPNYSTHNDWRGDDKLPMTHRWQVYGGLWVTGRKWCDFISYDPRVTDYPYWSVRVARDEKMIAEVSVKITKFVDELKAIMLKLSGPKF